MDNLIQHRCSHRMAEELGRDSKVVVARVVETKDIVMWNLRDIEDYVEPPKFIDLSIRMTIAPKNYQQVCSIVKRYDTSGFAKITTIKPDGESNFLDTLRDIKEERRYD